MKVVIKYDVHEQSIDHSNRACPLPCISIHKERYYENLTLSFEYDDDTKILEETKRIMDHEEDTDMQKVDKIKLLFCYTVCNEYEFDNDTRQCVIYYDKEPPKKLYIRVCTRMDPMPCRYCGYGSFEERVPVKVFTEKPSHLHGVTEFEYKPGNSWDRCEMYVDINIY